MRSGARKFSPLIEELEGSAALIFEVVSPMNFSTAHMTLE
jgi:hypothetical protein